jgi:ubiquinone/menaquinone biosynthesis C-methylase UbiE
VSSLPGSAVSPEPIFEGLTSFRLSAALKTGIEIDLFTGIAEGKSTPATLSAHCQAAERGVRILCDFLVINEFLTKDDGHYALSPTAAMFLDRRSPAYLGTMANFLASTENIDFFKDLTSAVRHGGAVFQPGGTVAPENPMWVEFARSMAPLMALPAELIAQGAGAVKGKVKVLDIAAGHGLFGIAIARHNPEAEIYAVDWPAVLEVARENAEKAGVAGRYHALPGNAFDVEFGDGYDVVLLTNFLHHFDPRTIEAFLRKVRTALADGGRAIALEFVPNEDRISPRVPASFSIIMLGTTPAGDAYTFHELEQMFRNAGFESAEMQALPPTVQNVILARK